MSGPDIIRLSVPKNLRLTTFDDNGVLINRAITKNGGCISLNEKKAYIFPVRSQASNFAFQLAVKGEQLASFAELEKTVSAILKDPFDLRFVKVAYLELPQDFGVHPFVLYQSLNFKKVRKVHGWRKDLCEEEHTSSSSTWARGSKKVEQVVVYDKAAHLNEEAENDDDVPKDLARLEMRLGSGSPKLKNLYFSGLREFLSTYNPFEGINWIELDKESESFPPINILNLAIRGLSCVCKELSVPPIVILNQLPAHQSRKLKAVISFVESSPQKRSNPPPFEKIYREEMDQFLNGEKKLPTSGIWRLDGTKVGEVSYQQLEKLKKHQRPNRKELGGVYA